MPLILPGSAPAPGPGYQIANSCRFNDGDSSYVHKAFGTPTDNDKWTLSMWIKRGVIGVLQNLMGCWVDGDHHTILRINATDQLDWYDWDRPTAPKLVTNRVFRDPSAWYHIVIVYDSGNGTEGNRMQTWVNGVRETSFATDNYPDADRTPLMNTSGNTVEIARRYDGGYFDGYMAEVVFIDGLALTPTSFGEYDSNSPTIWKPKDVSELTFGTNGFYLDFEDSANLGNDANGGTDLTEVNLDATDQATDTPTNNFCTMNPLSLYHTNTPTLSQGNCRLSGTAAGEYGVTGTMGVSSGKWYFEMKKVSQDSGPDDDSERNVFGITAKPYGILAGKYADPESWMLLGSSKISNNSTEIASVGASMLSDGGILQCALDLDNNRVAFGHDDAWQTGSSAFSGSYSDYESITAAASTISGFYFPVIGDNSGSRGYTMDANFGGCPPNAIASAAADENGYGTFEFAPPTGFLALCTKNLGSDGG